MRRVALRALPTPPPPPPPTSSVFLSSPYVRAPQPPPLAVSVVCSVRSSTRVCRSHSGEHAGTSLPSESRRRRHVFGEYLLNAAYDTVVRRRARNRSGSVSRPNEGRSLPTYRERERVVRLFKKRLRCSKTPDLQSASIRNPFRSFIRPWVLNLRRFTHTVLGRNSRRAIRKTKVSNTTVVRRSTRTRIVRTIGRWGDLPKNAHGRVIGCVFFNCALETHIPLVRTLQTTLPRSRGVKMKFGGSEYASCV